MLLNSPSPSSRFTQEDREGGEAGEGGWRGHSEKTERIQSSCPEEQVKEQNGTKKAGGE